MTQDPKAELRQAAFAARKAAHRDAGDKTAIATGHLLAAIGAAKGRVIAGYMPIRTEIDPLPAMSALHALGARLCVPVIAGAGQPLDFREWTPGGPMVAGPFGAQVPKTGAWLVPDILIVPLVAFDSDRNRLGYGGGFYDRTLERLRASAHPTAIGFAYAAQQVPAVPVASTDQPLDAVVTERGTLRP